MKRLLLLIPILLLCGCANNNRNCVKSHIETQIRRYPNSNGTLRMVVVPVSVCDEWEYIEVK